MSPVPIRAAPGAGNGQSRLPVVRRIARAVQRARLTWRIHDPFTDLRRNARGRSPRAGRGLFDGRARTVTGRRVHGVNDIARAGPRSTAGPVGTQAARQGLERPAWGGPGG